MRIDLNLLPEEKKAQNRSKQIFRFVNIQGILIVFVFVFTATMFFGINKILDIELSTLEDISGDLNQQGGFKEIHEFENSFKEVNSLVKMIADIQENHLRWINFFSELNLLVPNDVTLTSVSTKDFVILISGTASSRDDLLLFQDNLNGSECFSNVELPYSYLVSKNNTDFQIDVEIKNECLKNHK